MKKIILSTLLLSILLGSLVISNNIGLAETFDPGTLEASHDAIVEVTGQTESPYLKSVDTIDFGSIQKSNTIEFVEAENSPAITVANANGNMWTIQVKRDGEFLQNSLLWLNGVQSSIPNQIQGFNVNVDETNKNIFQTEQLVSTPNVELQLHPAVSIPALPKVAEYTTTLLWTLTIAP